ncbi:MAG TPA: M20/M25/M40 family metallo-hydrolase [Armatimonadota bacterium]|jgi:tripeptide aminopeptidase
MAIRRERLVEHLLRLLQIDTPPKHECPLADLLEAELRSLGFETRRDDAGADLGGDTGNLIAYRKGEVPQAQSLLLNAHMDTVQPTGGAMPVVEEEWIRSAGQAILGADDKAGIAIIMEALRSLADDGTPCGDLEVVFSICEEIGLEGARRLDTTALRSKVAYVFDSGKPIQEICTAAPTQEDLKVTVLGKASHAGAAPEKGVSAIVAASKAIASMSLGRIDSETTANVGIIHGGQATNIIPDRLELRAEARSRAPEKLQAQVQHMVERFRTCAEEAGATAEVEVERRYSGYRVPDDDPVVQRVMEAMREVGLDPSTRPGGGGSDANIFNKKGVRAVVLGCGYMEIHGVKECVEIADMVKAAEVAAALIRRTASA